jgi:hypothetical protein
MSKGIGLTALLHSSCGYKNVNRVMVILRWAQALRRLSVCAGRVDG